MKGKRHGTSVRGAYICCTSTITDFKAILCEEAQNILDTLAVQKYFSELRQAGSLQRDEGVHIYTSERDTNVNNHPKDRFPSDDISFLEDPQLALASVVRKVYDSLGLNRFTFCTSANLCCLKNVQ